MELYPNGNPRPHQEWDPAERCMIGRDPRTLSVAEFEKLGHSKRLLLSVIRQNCIQCAGGSQAEVRRCRPLWCPMWPYRCGTNPFAAERTAEQKALAQENFQRARQAANSSTASGISGAEVCAA